MTKVKAWSYSIYGAEKKCPFALKCRVDKVKPFATTPAMERGTAMHKKAENVVKGIIKGIPKELRRFKGEFNNLIDMFKDKSVVVECENDVAVTKDFAEPTTYDDWNNVWCRGSDDLIVIDGKVGTIIDYKSGKIYEDSHKEQGEVYVPLTAAHHPEVEEWDVEMWYLDQGEVLNWSYNLGDMDQLKDKWSKRGNKILARKKFPMTPGRHCSWCAYSLSNGGPCKNG